MPWCRKWTAEKIAALERMKAQGMTNKAIAYAIGHSHNAVTNQVTIHKLGRKPSEPKVQETATVNKLDLPVWYSLGWRVESFDSTTCRLIWLASVEPRRPRQFADMEAA